MSSGAQECVQLDGEERLQTASEARSGQEAAVRALSQSVGTLGVRLRADADEAEALRGAVMHLLRHTEAAVHAFKRAHAWREAGRAAPGQPLPGHIAELGGPVALPSAFLVETIDSLADRVRVQEAAAKELEAVLQPGGRRYTATAGGTDPASIMASLHAAVTNLHDCLMRSAARLQTLDDRVTAAKAATLAAAMQTGDVSDPFAEAERLEQLERSRQQQRNGEKMNRGQPQGTTPQTGERGVDSARRGVVAGGHLESRACRMCGMYCT